MSPMTSPPTSAITSAVAKARPVSHAWRGKSSSVMIAASLRKVAAGDGSTSWPRRQLPSCHNRIIATISTTTSASAVLRRAPSRAAAIGSTSAAPCIEPLLPDPEGHVDGADSPEEQDHEAVHRRVVEGIVGKGDGVSDARAGLHELAGDYADEGISDREFRAREEPRRGGRQDHAQEG